MTSPIMIPIEGSSPAKFDTSVTISDDAGPKCYEYATERMQWRAGGELVKAIQQGGGIAMVTIRSIGRPVDWGRELRLVVTVQPATLCEREYYGILGGQNEKDRHDCS